MQVFLVRVAADTTIGGGNWNGPVDAATGRFAYVPIPERKKTHPGHEKPYSSLTAVLQKFGVKLPEHLAREQMHLDPDFEHSTYGDLGRKGAQLHGNLNAGDRVVFYSGLRDIHTGRLVYAIIGVILVQQVDRAISWSFDRYHRNAHTRRLLAPDARDIIVVGNPKGSGRLTRCISIGEYRDRAYRVRSDILRAWGGISANNGYLQRSAVFPSINDPDRFMTWWKRYSATLVHANNIDD